MRHITAVLLAVTTTLWAPIAMADAPPLTAKLPAAKIIAHPALWKVSKGATTIYLFGTVHVLPAGVDWQSPELTGAADSADQLVTEIIEQSPDQMRAIVTAKAMLPAGPTLRAMLTPAERRAFERAMVKNALPVAAFDRFQPWYAAVALSTLPLLHSGYDPANGADAQLANRAKAHTQTHEALETAEYQLGLFSSLPMVQQKRYLREVVRSLPHIKGELGQMIAAWEAGDALRLARLMNADEDDPALRQVLLVNRNKAWAAWIRARLKKPGTVFIAVGAGHLAGRDSVQDQLRALGIAATRVQ